MSDILEKNILSFLERYPQWQDRFKTLDRQQVLQDYALEKDQDSFVLKEKSEVIDHTRWHIHLPREKACRVAFLENFGLGHSLQQILNEGGSQLTDVVIIEPSLSRFVAALSVTDFNDLFLRKDVHFLIGLRPEECFGALFDIFRLPPRSFRMDAFHFFEHPILSSAQSAYFSRIQDEWNAVRNQIRRNYGNLEDSLVGLRNTVANSKWIHEVPGINGFRNQFEGVPAVLVSAGPSLKKSLPHLKTLQNKAVIIANDVVVSILEKAGIEPHFVCSLERDIGSQKCFEAIKSQSLRSILVAYPIVPSSVLKAFPGRSVATFRDYSFHLYMDHVLQKGVLSSSSSVAHMGLRLADFLGCAQLALIGQDLAYDPATLQSHSEGIAYEEWSQKSSVEVINAHLEKTQQGSLIYIQGNLEPTVPSNPTYFSFLKEFSYERLRSRLKIVNCTQGGAAIPGIPWRDFEEVTELWSTQDAIFEKIEDIFCASAPTPSFTFEAVVEYLEAGRQRLNQLSVQAKQVARPGQIPSEQQKPVLDLLMQAKNDFERTLAFMAFVMEMNARELLDLENRRACLQFRSGSDYAKHFELLSDWFSLMERTAGRVHDILSSTQSL